MIPFIKIIQATDKLDKIAKQESMRARKTIPKNVKKNAFAFIRMGTIRRLIQDTKRVIPSLKRMILCISSIRGSWKMRMQGDSTISSCRILGPKWKMKRLIQNRTNSINLETYPKSSILNLLAIIFRKARIAK